MMNCCKPKKKKEKRMNEGYDEGDEEERGTSK
jgi:hypothetical protein